MWHWSSSWASSSASQSGNNSSSSSYSYLKCPTTRTTATTANNSVSRPAATTESSLLFLPSFRIRFAGRPIGRHAFFKRRAEGTSQHHNQQQQPSNLLSCLSSLDHTPPLSPNHCAVKPTLSCILPLQHTYLIDDGNDDDATTGAEGDRESVCRARIHFPFLLLTLRYSYKLAYIQFLFF